MTRIPILAALAVAVAAIAATPRAASRPLEPRASQVPPVRTEGSMVYVTLPDDTPRDSLASIPWRARVVDPVVAEAARTSDAIVQFVRHDGRPALPVNLGVPPVVQARALRFTFDSLVQPWTYAEIARMQAALAALYPLAVEVYGEPAFDATINIRKSSSAWFSSGLNEIGLVNAEEVMLCHEMLHAFHDDAVIGIGPYEEGMAEAGVAAVMKRQSHYWSSNQRHGATMSYYDLLNRPEIAAWLGGFATNARRELRYHMSDYLWTKFELELPTFLADFNRAYYADYETSGIPFWGSNEESRLEAIVRAVKPEVEGIPVDRWFGEQHMLNLRPAQGGYVLYQLGFGEDAVSSMTWVHVFQRDPSETPLANTPVRLRILDPAGHLLSDTTVATQDDGAAPFRVDLPEAYQRYSGRLEVIASVTTPDGGTLAGTTYRSRGRENGLFGVVVGALNGSVMAVHLPSGATATTTLTNGCFDLPATAELAGEFRVTFRAADGRTAERIVTKDSSPYYVGFEVGPSPVAVNLVRNPSFEEESFSGWDGYGGSTLRRAPGGRDGSAHCLEIQGPRAIQQFGTNDHPNWTMHTTAGTRYRFTAWVSSPSSGSSRLRVREYLAGVRVGDAVYSNRVALAPGWQMITIEYVVKRDDSWLDLQIVADPKQHQAVLRVDDVSIEMMGSSLASEETGISGRVAELPSPAAGPEFARRVIFAPNPLSTGAELRFTTARPGPYEVALYDVNGRLIRILARATFADAASHRVPIARQDATGALLRPGICFYRIVAGDETFTGRVAIVD